MNKMNYNIFIDILKTFEYRYVHIYIYTYLQISLGVRFSALNCIQRMYEYVSYR